MKSPRLRFAIGDFMVIVVLAAVVLAVEVVAFGPEAKRLGAKAPKGQEARHEAIAWAAFQLIPAFAFTSAGVAVYLKSRSARRQ